MILNNEFSKKYLELSLKYIELNDKCDIEEALAVGFIYLNGRMNEADEGGDELNEEEQYMAECVISNIVTVKKALQKEYDTTQDEDVIPWLDYANKILHHFEANQSKTPLSTYIPEKVTLH